MEGPPLGPGGEDITWPDQVAPQGRKASSTRKIKPQTSNLNEPGSRPASACPTQPASKAGGASPRVGKGTTAWGKPTGAPRATGLDEARRTTRGHEARQRGTPPATTKSQRQVPSSDGRRVPQTRRARTTRNEPRHEDRCQATPAAL